MNLRLWTILLESFPKILLQGIKVTLPLTAVSFLFALIISVIVAMIQYANIPVLKKICRFYIWLIRGTPLLVQLYVVFYGLPSVGIVLDAWPSAVFVLAFNEGAYMAETVRAGIKSIDAGQREGALALGMSPISAMFHIILPQAFKNIVPEMANMFLTNLKMTSVLNVIGVQELFLQAKTAGGTYYKYLESYLVIALIYLVLCFVFSRVFALIEKKTAVRKDYVLAVEYMENTQ